VIDGTIDAIVDAISGDLLAGALDITMTMDLINFQVTIGTDVLLSNGDATASLDNTVQLVASAAVSGSSMTTDTNTGSETLTNYASAQTVDANFDPAPYTMTASGTLDSSQLDGVVDYSTPVMFQGFDANYPSSGELLVSSTDSSARLIAVDDVNVRIEIYSNATGTGTPDSTILTTWAALAAM
jgi:hypothetical protein